MARPGRPPWGGAEKLGGRGARGRPGRRAHAASAAGPPTHPIAPTEFPKGRSAAGRLGAHGPQPTAACAPQEEATAPRSRPKAATGAGVPPGVSLEALAGGHRSTDPIIAHRARGAGGTSVAAGGPRRRSGHARRRIPARPRPPPQRWTVARVSCLADERRGLPGSRTTVAPL